MLQQKCSTIPKGRDGCSMHYTSRHPASCNSNSYILYLTSPQRCRHDVAPCKASSLGGCVDAASATVFHPQVLQETAALDISGSPAAYILPATALLAGAAALKFYFYSQLEYITAAMLTRYVPKGGRGATVIQLGGGTRELYYYPKDTMTVINVGKKVNKGLMEQAGVTAAVPTIVKQQPITDLSFQADASVDAVVALGVLSQLSSTQRQQCLDEVARVLKPGMPLIFVEPAKEGGSPLRGLVGVSAGKQLLSAADLQTIESNNAFSYTQFDMALEGQDPHAVGVAVKSETYQAKRRGAEEAVRKQRIKQPKTAKGFNS